MAFSSVLFNFLKGANKRYLILKALNLIRWGKPKCKKNADISKWIGKILFLKINEQNDLFNELM